MSKLQRFSYRTRPEYLKTQLELKREGLTPTSRAVGFFGGTPCFTTLLFDQRQAVRKSEPEAPAQRGPKSRACARCGELAQRGRNLHRGGLCAACHAKRQMEEHFPGHLSLYEKATSFYRGEQRLTPVEAMAACQALLSGPTLFLDTEATGARATEIIELGLVDTAGQTVYHSLIHAHRPCNPIAYSMHQISDAQLRHAPRFTEVWPAIKELLLTHTIVIFDAPSDLSFLAQTLAANGIVDPDMDRLDIRCAMRLYRDYRETGDCIGLQRACQQMGLEDVQHHRVIGDCQMTLALVQRIAAGAKPLETATAEEEPSLSAFAAEAMSEAMSMDADEALSASSMI